MTARPSYRFTFAIVDETSGDVVSADFCAITTIDQDGGCQNVDHHVARMLRAFTRSVRDNYEAENYPATEPAEVA